MRNYSFVQYYPLGLYIKFFKLFFNFEFQREFCFAMFECARRAFSHPKRKPRILALIVPRTFADCGEMRAIL